MQIQAVNRRARENYGAFWGALQLVDEALNHVEVLLKRLPDESPDPSNWRVPEPDEIRGAHVKSDRALEVLAKSAKRWETELVSRAWRH